MSDTNDNKSKSFFLWRAARATGRGIKSGTFATGRGLKAAAEGVVVATEVVVDHTPGFVKSGVCGVGRGASLATGVLLAVAISDRFGGDDKDATDGVDS